MPVYKRRKAGMTLGDFGAIAGIVVCVVLIGGLIYSFARGGLSFFGKLKKIDRIERGVDALLLIHANELITLYKDKIKLVFNPNSFPERDELLAKLERGYLTPSEADRLTQILRYEEAEAKRKDQQMAVLAIGALLLLVILISKK